MAKTEYIINPEMNGKGYAQAIFTSKKEALKYYREVNSEGIEVTKKAKLWCLETGGYTIEEL